MKILIINGSPKGKGSNTYKLSSAFAEGIKEKVGAEVEELHVNNLDIKPCLGCFSCWNKTPGECVIKDDMSSVLERILAADLVIWSFGLYYFNVPGKMKNLIDRQLPLALPFMVKDSESGGHPARYDMSGKKHVVISTCGFYTAEGNYGSVDTMFDHFIGKDKYEKIYCAQGELFRIPELRDRTDEYLGSVKKAGGEYISGGISSETREQLDTLLFPRETYEAMADASWGIDNQTGEKEDPEYLFTKQMAALYNRESYKGKDIVLEMDYTDVGKKYQVILSRDGSEVIRDHFREYTTRIETPYTVWRDIAAGKITGTEAMMKRLYRVDGDFSLMVNWDKYFGSAKPPKPAPERGKSQKNTNMMLLLLPWIAFWIGAPIDSFYGSIAAIAVCALLPLLFFRNQKTVYDVISTAAVSVFSLLLLSLGGAALIVPISYLSFGLMWSLSCLAKVPLTAHYSKNSYNGDSALENPLFIKTNAILSFLWGILYVLTSAWTFFLMRSDYSVYTAVINNIIPIVMGIFTKWFQNWYPAWYAKR